MLELIFQGFLEWAYGLALECWQYFSTALLDIMSMDFAYLKSHAPVVDEIMQILLAVGWALLIGNLVFQALKSMAVGLGFEGEDPKLLFARTFVFAFLLLASPQICEIGLSMTSKIIRDIREAHKKDSESAPQTTVADELKENLEAVENFKGSRDEKLVVLYCKQLGINYKNLSDEEFRWLIRILKKSKKMGTPISQRKKR